MVVFFYYHVVVSKHEACRRFPKTRFQRPYVVNDYIPYSTTYRRFLRTKINFISLHRVSNPCTNNRSSVRLTAITYRLVYFRKIYNILVCQQFEYIPDNEKISYQSSNDGFFFTIEYKNVNLFAVKSAIYYIR